MRLDALSKLRMAFIALGAALALPFAWLVNAAEQRIEAQRRLRHEVVAERIFDELERELTRVLREESSAPSHSYDEARPISTWPPYVVGYFTTDGQSTRLLEADQLSPERRKRLSTAIEQESLELAVSQANQDKSDSLQNSQAVPSKARARSASPADVMRQLNRAKEERAPSLGQKARY